jgi:hypothetical protein
MPLILHGFNGVDARDERGHDESEMARNGFMPSADTAF